MQFKNLVVGTQRIGMDFWQLHPSAACMCFLKDRTAAFCTQAHCPAPPAPVLHQSVASPKTSSGCRQHPPHIHAVNGVGTHQIAEIATARTQDCQNRQVWSFRSARQQQFSRATCHLHCTALHFIAHSQPAQPRQEECTGQFNAFFWACCRCRRLRHGGWQKLQWHPSGAQLVP